MGYELVTTESFLADLLNIPKNVQKRIVRATRTIQSDPFTGGGNSKKCFKQRYSNVYRFRSGDYRIIYCLGNKCIKFLMVDLRSKIYQRFETSSDAEVSYNDNIIEPIPIRTTHFDEPRDFPSLIGEDKETISAQGLETENRHIRKLFEELLHEWGVCEEDRKAILQCNSIEDIFDLDIDDAVKERILRWDRPTKIHEVIEEPVYELPSSEHLADFVEGTLKGFLLKMDPDQEKVSRKNLKGPTLVKGGPGTGKSLVALYRIRNLMQPDAQKSMFDHKLPRTLFVTYTTTLINASRQLLAPLLGDAQKYVDVKNLDKIVRTIIGRASQLFNPVPEAKRMEIIKTSIEIIKKSNDYARLAKLLDRVTVDYIIEEFDWVIEGREIRDLDEYCKEDRSGRGIPFDSPTRQGVWDLYEIYKRLLEKNDMRTWDQLRSEALRCVTSGEVDIERYDVVIVDEAQDLTPVGLKLCFSLCKSPKGFYMTADSGQSIYNRGFSWKRVDEAINVRGRSTILKYNYRSTRQIMEAAIQPLRDHGGADPETLRTISVREGPKPKMICCSDDGEHAVALTHFLKSSAEEVRLPVHCGCVLVRSNRTGEQIAEELRTHGIPAALVKGSDFDLDQKVVKVMTIHSAKGLEFPVVAIARLDRDQMPLMLWSVTDPDEMQSRVMEERRLLCVGLSRAMRRLAVTYTKTKPSIFIHEMDNQLWDWRNFPVTLLSKID